MLKGLLSEGPKRGMGTESDHQTCKYRLVYIRASRETKYQYQLTLDNTGCLKTVSSVGLEWYRNILSKDFLVPMRSRVANSKGEDVRIKAVM